MDTIKKKKQTCKKTDAFFLPVSWTFHMQGKEIFYIIHTHTHTHAYITEQ